MYGDRDREVGEARVEQEIAAQVAAARRRLSGIGRATCECGATIGDFRRTEFAATRCIECQKDFEMDCALR